MRRMKMKKTSISVPEKLFTEFKLACVSKGELMSNVLQAFMAEYAGGWIESEGKKAEKEFEKRIGSRRKEVIGSKRM